MEQIGEVMDRLREVMRMKVTEMICMMRSSMREMILQSGAGGVGDDSQSNGGGGGGPPGGGTVHDVGAPFSNGVGGTPTNLDCLPALYPSLDLYPKVLFSAKNF
jgi:hypothetical protein